MKIEALISFCAGIGVIAMAIVVWSSEGFLTYLFRIQPQRGPFAPKSRTQVRFAARATAVMAGLIGTLFLLNGIFGLS